MKNVILEEPQSEWAIKIKGNEDNAKRIANENDFKYIGKVGNLDQTYHFREKSNSLSTKIQSTVSKEELLYRNKDIHWVAHQETLVRSKRNAIVKRNDDTDEQLIQDREVKTMFNDPEWINQWNLYDARKSRKETKEDLNLIPVWKMNITGRGVTVSIIDDGIDYTSPDLKNNYDPKASFDINDNDADPMPNLAPGTSNDHGTHCAAEVAMEANNKICGVGVAFNSRIGGIRMLDGKISDITEAKSLGFNNNHIDIYSSSWGPNDDGLTMEKPGRLASEALLNGVTKGRNGKGNIYVWAAGNGGIYNDSCACDGYVSSMYSISINSINPDSTIPYYIEKCSSTMAVTFSTYSDRKSKLIVADVHGGCTKMHGGTSASAPYAAGIFALALEANPNLTWRDIKHLVTWTCQVSPLIYMPGWQKNNAGFWVSDTLGFGQMDAQKFVINSKSWITVPKMTSCTMSKKMNFSISNVNSANTTFDGTECYSKVKFIEHIIITTSFQYSERGALYIVFISPHGMKTTLLPLRYLDKKNTLMTDWPFNTVHNWGEDPRGLWSVSFEDKKNDQEKRMGIIKDVSITFYGTNIIPHHIKLSKRGKRKYNNNHNRVKGIKRNLETSLNLN